jgi:hypothetical protein
VSGELHAPAALPLWERALGTYWIGGWVNPRACLDDVEKRKFLTLPGFELRPLGRPAPRQSLYRLQYPCSPINIVHGPIRGTADVWKNTKEVNIQIIITNIIFNNEAYHFHSQDILTHYIKISH